MGSLGENCIKKVRRKPGLPRRVDQMSKEVLQATLLKKRECNRRAQMIVERLLEDTVPQDWFLNSLQYISESHFQDVVEERALTKLCGYPICRGQLPPAPSQQFRISTRLNKVYDITDRKNFCSNWCYAAGKFLKKQLLTSPLWLRDKEEAPVFTLLPTTGASDGVGDELDFGVEKVVANKCEPSLDHTVGSELKTSAAVTEIVEKHASELGAKLATREPAYGEREILSQDCVRSGVSDANSGRNKYSEVGSASQNIRKESPKWEVEMTVSIASRSGVGSDCVVAAETESSEEPGNVDFKEKVECGGQSIKCAVDSENLGSKCIVELKRENCKPANPFSDSSVEGNVEPGPEATADKHREAQKKGSKGKTGQSRKSGEEPGLKSVVLYVEKCVKEWFTVNTLRLVVGEESQDFLGDSGVPLVDHHAQAALRRRIVMDQLNRVVPDLMAALGVVNCDISSDVRELVTTFCLGAHNITFHVPEWNLLSLILINIVSLKNMRLQRQLRSKKVKEAQAMILLSFQQDSGYVDRLMCWLIEGDHKLC